MLHYQIAPSLDEITASVNLKGVEVVPDKALGEIGDTVSYSTNPEGLGDFLSLARTGGSDSSFDETMLESDND